jgi:hypothetical protein
VRRCNGHRCVTLASLAKFERRICHARSAILGERGQSQRIDDAASSPLAEDSPMNMYLGIGPVVALIAGVLILIVPRLLNYIVAIYLITIGIIGLFGVPGLHYRGTSVLSHHRSVPQRIYYQYHEPTWLNRRVSTVSRQTD